MDCEKFDRVVLEMLYDELDELTNAAAKRHMDHCSRCSSVGARLKATREVGVLPRLAAPAGLEAKILKMEREARQALPWRERMGRTISVLAGYAMRPQLAMALLLVLMIGSSFLFLRQKPGDADSVHVTERGIREADESVAIVPLPEPGAEPLASAAPAATEVAKAESKPVEPPPAEARAPKPAAVSEPLAAAEQPNAGDEAFEKAMSAYRQGDYSSARSQFEAIAGEGGERAPSAYLYAAHATRDSVGCTEAAPKFDEVNGRFPGSNVAQEATWQAASCYRSLGHLDLARIRYQRLLDAPAYADRAQHALARLSAPETEAVASRKTAPAAAAPAAPIKARPPTSTSKAGSGSKATIDSAH